MKNIPLPHSSQICQCLSELSPSFSLSAYMQVIANVDQLQVFQRYFVLLLDLLSRCYQIGVRFVVEIHL